MAGGGRRRERTGACRSAPRAQPGGSSSGVSFRPGQAGIDRRGIDWRVPHSRPTGPGAAHLHLGNHRAAQGGGAVAWGVVREYPGHRRLPGAHVDRQCPGESPLLLLVRELGVADAHGGRCATGARRRRGLLESQPRPPDCRAGHWLQRGPLDLRAVAVAVGVRAPELSRPAVCDLRGGGLGPRPAPPTAGLPPRGGAARDVWSDRGGGPAVDAAPRGT